jgi:hypothetical protein
VVVLPALSSPTTTSLYSRAGNIRNHARDIHAPILPRRGKSEPRARRRSVSGRIGGLRKRIGSDRSAPMGQGRRRSASRRRGGGGRNRLVRRRLPGAERLDASVGIRVRFVRAGQRSFVVWRRDQGTAVWARLGWSEPRMSVCNNPHTIEL